MKVTCFYLMLSVSLTLQWSLRLRLVLFLQELCLDSPMPFRHFCEERRQLRRALCLLAAPEHRRRQAPSWEQRVVRESTSSKQCSTMCVPTQILGQQYEQQPRSTRGMSLKVELIGHCCFEIKWNKKSNQIIFSKKKKINKILKNKKKPKKN